MPSFSLHSPIISSALQAIPSTLGLHNALAGQHVLVTGGTGFWLVVVGVVSTTEPARRRGDGHCSVTQPIAFSGCTALLP
jgi:hypothetical protein